MDTGDELELATLTDLAVAMHKLFEAGRQAFEEAAPPGELQRLVTDHLGGEIRETSFVGEDFQLWQHANVQRGVNAYLAEHSPESEWFGIGGMGRGHEGLSTILASDNRFAYSLSAVTHSTVATGPDSTMEAVAFGLIPSVAPDGAPIMIALRGEGHFGPPLCRLEVIATDRHTAVAARDEIDRLMREHDVFRGHVLSFGTSEHRGNELLSFQPRPEVTADQVILPEGVLASVERHILGVTANADALRRTGQHLKRGLLLHGAPGTGKTHTVRYLMGRLRESTVILMTGQAMRWIEQAAALARRLQPAMVVLEDVDLIAHDREFSPDGIPLLFTLLDAMDGVGADADVTFVLTTNRADVLERALADRPGRVDLAVEVPRPNAAARERLIRLYAGSLPVEGDLTAVIAATEGVTASFVKELLRRTVLAALRDSPASVQGIGAADFVPVLEEIAHERESLTRSLLGQSDDAPVRDPLTPVVRPGLRSWGRHE